MKKKTFYIGIHYQITNSFTFQFIYSCKTGYNTLMKINFFAKVRTLICCREFRCMAHNNT